MFPTPLGGTWSRAVPGTGDRHAFGISTKGWRPSQAFQKPEPWGGGGGRRGRPALSVHVCPPPPQSSSSAWSPFWGLLQTLQATSALSLPPSPHKFEWGQAGATSQLHGRGTSPLLTSQLWKEKKKGLRCFASGRSFPVLNFWRQEKGT